MCIRDSIYIYPDWPPLPWQWKPPLPWQWNFQQNWLQLGLRKRFLGFFFAHIGGFWGWAIKCCQSHFPLTDPRCHGNKICDKIGYNSACVRDICEIFCTCEGVFRNGPSNAANWTLPWLPWQQNLRQNGLYLSLYNKYHQDPCIWQRCGLRVWQFDDVSQSLLQPTLISWYNE